MQWFSTKSKPVTLIQSYMSGKICWIKRFGKVSTYRPIRSGVPQGSLLGPELFILLTSDLLDINFAIYEDETALFTIPRDDALVCWRLQNSVDAVVVLYWSNKRRFQINLTKGELMRFSGKRKASPTTITIQGEPLPSTYNVLG